MDKRRLKFITWGFVLLTAVIVALMLMSNLRRSSRVELPDTENDAQGSENVPTEGSALTVVEVRPETVQAAIETLHRPQAYRRSVTVEYLWNSDSGTAEMTTAVLNGWTRVDRTLADGQTRHVITDGTVSYIWYNEESDSRPRRRPVYRMERKCSRGAAAGNHHAGGLPHCVRCPLYLCGNGRG